MSIEQNFDVPFVAAMALREKQIQQNYRPVIGVHKWFARRPGTLFRGLILAEFVDLPLERSFFRANDLAGVRVADPFMGGGTPLIEANRVGCDVQGMDINPMSTWIVRQEIQHLDLPAYQQAASALLGRLRAEIDGLYRTNCPIYGDEDVPVKCFLWVKEIDCSACGASVDLFPGYLVAENKRHPKNVLVCPCCGNLNEVEDRNAPGACQSCGGALSQIGPARKGRCPCPACGHVNSYPGDAERPLRHRLFALEYFNPKRKAMHPGRFFKKPDAADLQRMEAAAERWRSFSPRFVPDEQVLLGDETRRLHRWGCKFWRDLFNPRQLLGLELSCRLIDEMGDERLRGALATNLSDLLRYQNMLCRYHAGALKCLDIFSVHGFPVGLIQCESNLLGIVDGSGANVGSGGWSNVIAKFVKAKQFCEAPFEIVRDGSKNLRIPITGEQIGETMNGRRKSVALDCGSAASTDLQPRSLDAVFTDPPYFGNVQYAELMDFCHVWLRRLVGPQAQGFDRTTTKSPEELTGNDTQQRGLNQFAEGLAGAWAQMARALKPGAPLAFTYHHNQLSAYCAVGVAILDAGLACTASLPCPAEMSGSIHIHGTRSSIVDTIFVCRSVGAAPRRWLCETTSDLMAVVAEDLADLEEAGRSPSLGDVRCILFGHLARLAIWHLRSAWEAGASTQAKMERFAEATTAFGDPEELAQAAWAAPRRAPSPGLLFSEARCQPEIEDAVSF